MNLNLEILFTLNGILGTSPLIDGIVLFFAQYYVFLIILIAGVVWYRDIYTGSLLTFWKNTKALIASVLGAELLTEFIRFIYESPRPLHTLNIPYLFDKTSNSFPSGHTMFVFSLATAMYFFGNKKLAWMLYASGLLIGIARITAGIHYPSDILGGIVLGILTGYCAHYLFGPKKIAT
ncbi:phosphatase PAP2 family protein [Candidatus Campbellbacteria bacterium]|nr:MAG: phosphatase PAP2 family protein [Candidatus Campbellbacteria bacterium]